MTLRTLRLGRERGSPRSAECERLYVDDEAELESIVNTVPEALLDEPVLMIGRQVQLGTGVLDLLALDRWANTLVLELKRGKSDVGSASEATILSQPLAYARSLSGYGYDTLDREYRDYRDQLAEGDWESEPSTVFGDSLADAFESKFGTELDTEAYNREQRVAIVAEDVTPRTRRNARYLVQQGVPFQCIEIGLFDVGETVVSTATVVDHDESHIRPPRHNAPRFPKLNRRIAELALPRIRETVSTDIAHGSFSNLDKRTPWLRSQQSDHPEAVIYRWKIAPQQTNREITPGNVAVRVDIETGVDAEERLAVLRNNAHRFREREFTFEDGRSTFAIAHDHWQADPAQLDSEEFLDEIAERFAELVELGHDVLADSGNTDGERAEDQR